MFILISLMINTENLLFFNNNIVVLEYRGIWNQVSKLQFLSTFIYISLT